MLLHPVSFLGQIDSVDLHQVNGSFLAMDFDFRTLKHQHPRLAASTAPSLRFPTQLCAVGGEFASFHHRGIPTFVDGDLRVPRWRRTRDTTRLQRGADQLR